MKFRSFCCLQISLAILFLLSVDSAAQRNQDFLQCLTINSHSNSSIAKVIFTPSNSSYTNVLQAAIQNLRFSSPSTPKPRVIVTPVDASQIQNVIYCSKKYGMEIRIRSGGHDFEGLSYVSQVPFVLLDMINLRSIDVDATSATAWVGAGATLGELYYGISQKSKTLGFGAGLWSNVGITGFLSGGGYGMMRRKYGLAADNVIDARMIDVNGKILDRKSMGEDLFWAIRGGGGSSFGVILSWKINLAPVPNLVTVFRVTRTLEQNATNIFHRFQVAAPQFPKDLDIRCYISSVLSNSSPRADKRTVSIIFESLFLGRASTLLQVMQQNFPELGLVREDCSEVSWIRSTPFFSNLSVTTSPEILINRNALPKSPFKGTSDFVQQPIPIDGLNGLWDILYKVAPSSATLQITPWGGRMYEISESAIPFPHRAGNLYMINMGVILDTDVTARLQWMQSLYQYFTPYVSKSPRAAYVNYNDLDFGVNNQQGKTTYAVASRWGKKYFKNNFDRLIKVKSKVDPGNFFKHEQSIPPL
ncbi:berberine bridge enzyme-like 18 [Heracleum sosnowskyi]|uniref:Berberine bridge enzyme-like 18 n=1 Tax=Heracleum sosnowskyi TaxID=360622 RepID=A0AAD8NAW8_9APIA|nr:berberine bridge enzyme-like 18 [Heracleum sosnowskyi]